MTVKLTAQEMERSLRAMKVPPALIARAVAAEMAKRDGLAYRATDLPENVKAPAPLCDEGAIYRAGEEEIAMLFRFPPRTKKNHGRAFGIRQSLAYVRFAAQVKAVVLRHAGLHLPMPDRAYNLAATFYVDKRGEPADLVGLLQGLCDALQDAGVVSDDWYFRKFDGSHIIFGDEKPRVVATVTAIDDPAVPRGTTEG